MAGRISRMKRSLVLRGLACITAAAMATAGLASPAHAWTDSADVDVFGFASCRTVPNAMDIMPDSARVRVEATGETAESKVDYWWAYWVTHLHTIPSQGSSVDLWIHCDVPGVGSEWRFVRTTVVKRPWFGRAVQMDWARA